ncbi:MAG: polysaccharide deacetylase [Desulfobacteraceae bacterium]|nr:MAG: polysaccharide deacetylase [Desulfobacteraceae bacterium]
MWQNGKKCAAVLSFDFDAESLWMAKNLTTPSVMSRGEYGARVGVPRIITMLEEYGIQATFFVPAETARRHSELVKEISSKGHEICHHGNIHENPAALDPDREEHILVTGIETLEKITGQRPAGYRSPSWDLSDASIGLLEKYDFAYDSSMMGDDFQPYLINDKGRQTNIVELPVSWELDDAPHFLFRFAPTYLSGMSSPSKVYDIWTTEFEGAYNSGGVFILTMHPQIIGRYHRLKMVRQLIDHIGGHPDIWFATCSEVVGDWLKGSA